MIQDDREYDKCTKVLKNLLLTSEENGLNHQKKIDKEIDQIIAIKKSFTNDLRLESNRITREKYTAKLAQHDETVRGILASCPAAIQTSSRAKVLSELIETSTMYSHSHNHVEGKGNAELISSAQGNYYQVVKSESIIPVCGN